MTLHTVADLAKRFGLSKQRLYAMRTSGILVENEHWLWVRGSVMHTDKAVGLLEARRKAKE